MPGPDIVKGANEVLSIDSRALPRVQLFTPDTLNALGLMIAVAVLLHRSVIVTVSGWQLRPTANTPVLLVIDRFPFFR